MDMRNATIRPGRVPALILVTTCALAATAAVALAASPGQADKPAKAPVPLLHLKEAAKPAAAPTEDPLGRSTPFGTVLGFVNAVEHQDLYRAVEYLDTQQPPKRARQLAQELADVLNAAELKDLSRSPEGDFAGGLPPGRERIGVVKTPSGSADIFLERVQRPAGPAVWLFSADTLKQVPQIHGAIGVSWVERHFSGTVLGALVAGYPLWRWLGILLALPLSFLVARFAGNRLIPVIGMLLGRLVKRPGGYPAERLKWPVRLLVLAIVFYAISFAALSAVSRLFWGYVAATMATIAVAWACLRLIDEAEGALRGRALAPLGSARIATERLLHRLAKAGVVLAGATVILYIAGVNLTAVLTGVGIGGIAIALAAQKYLENLFGVVTIISDKPIRVGDFCRAGEFSGVVEDIGLRSTRLRTAGRSVVSVPNGQLVTMSLENFSLRDKTLFNHRIHLGNETSADRVRAVAGAIRGLLAVHPAIEAETWRVSVTAIRDVSIEVEIFAYVTETDDAAFLAVQEELLLRIMEIVEANGVRFALPQPAPIRRRDRSLERDAG